MHFTLLLIATSLLGAANAGTTGARRPAIPALQPAKQQPAYQQQPVQQQPAFQQQPRQQVIPNVPAQHFPGQQQPQFQQIPVQQFPQDTTVTERTTVTASTFDTVTHYLQVTQTRDVVVTEAITSNLVLTQEVTVRQAQPGRANTVTAVVTGYQPSLVVETVQNGFNTGKVATATATVFVTTTQHSPCTSAITHYDRVLEQTVVPVQTVVYVNQVTTQTVIATVTQEVTSTRYRTASPGTNNGY